MTLVTQDHIYILNVSTWHSNRFFIDSQLGNQGWYFESENFILRFLRFLQPLEEFSGTVPSFLNNYSQYGPLHSVPRCFLQTQCRKNDRILDVWHRKDRVKWLLHISVYRINTFNNNVLISFAENEICLSYKQQSCCLLAPRQTCLNTRPPPTFRGDHLVICGL